ncbi:hypothetical protein J7E29_02475 [Streptomyces sp. ISL-90]|nr:hypothetical protein [Streptomyces sp. ISL-90]
MADKYTMGVKIETQPGVDFWRLARWASDETRQQLSQGRALRRFDGLSVATDDGRTYKRATVEAIESVMTDDRAVPTHLSDFIPSYAKNTPDLFGVIMLHYNPYARVHVLKVDFVGKDRLAVQRTAGKFLERTRGMLLEQIAPSSTVALSEVRVSSHDETEQSSRLARLWGRFESLNTRAKSVVVPVLVLVVAAILLGVLRACGVPIAV